MVTIQSTIQGQLAQQQRFHTAESPLLFCTMYNLARNSAPDFRDVLKRGHSVQHTPALACPRR